MTPHEKAVNAVNLRLERLQANLRESKTEEANRFLVQSLIVTIGLAQALADYVQSVNHHAQRRHEEIKTSNETLAAQHAGLLNSAREQLEKLKANPTDAVLRKEIARAQQAMTALQKTVRREANALQRELAPGVAMVDRMAESVRRLSGADENAALKRVLKAVVDNVRELYAALPDRPTLDVIEAEAWEKAVGLAVDQAAGFHDAYARAGYQTILALELMTLAMAENPPRTAGEATTRANDAVAARLKEITARFKATPAPEK